MDEGKLRRGTDQSRFKTIEISMYRGLQILVILKNHFITSQQRHTQGFYSRSSSVICDLSSIQ